MRAASHVLSSASSCWLTSTAASSFPEVDSLDKQYVRDYLLSINFDKKTGVELPADVIANTLRKYQEVYKILTGKEAAL